MTQSPPNAVEPEQPEAVIDDTKKDTSGAEGIPSWKTEDAEGPCGTAVPQHAGDGRPKPEKPEDSKTSQQSLPKAVVAEEPEADIDDATKNISGTKGIPSWKTEDAEEPGGTAVQQGAGQGGPTQQKPVTPKVSPATQSSPKSTGAQQPKARIDETKKDTRKRGAVVKISKISNDSILERIKNRLLTSKAGAGDAKQKTMALVIPVLFVILLFFVHKGGVFGNKVREAQASRIENLSSVDTADFTDGINWEIPAPFPVTLRDPMGPDMLEDLQTGTEAGTEIEAGTPVRLIVKGILYSEDEASAVVGEQIVHQGEMIKGATVIRIDKDSVEFEMNGKRWTEKVRGKSGPGESQQEQIRPDRSGKELL
ncbi:MAG: hypothetical protein ACYTDV_02815 [Planctomycetota bacterium]